MPSDYAVITDGTDSDDVFCVCPTQNTRDEVVSRARQPPAMRAVYAVNSTVSAHDVTSQIKITIPKTDAETHNGATSGPLNRQ